MAIICEGEKKFLGIKKLKTTKGQQKEELLQFYQAMVSRMPLKLGTLSAFAYGFL